ncbi:MAG: glycosyltransferase family 2 protein [Acidobacteria bacterium]|nr:glycosyltransferase family 2 protein [Acidobacteriota bacterium]
MTVDVSVVMPVKNGGQYLVETLDAILAQESRYRFEIVVVDSGSTDGSLDVLRARSVQLYTIPPEQFNHGLTRNLGIEKSSGRYVVLLTQDATPLGARWLDTLVRNLEEEGVAGAYCRQVARPDADPETKKSLESWIAGSAERRIQKFDPGEYELLPPMERYLRSYFDNVCSALKRSVWQDLPFPEAYFAEDCEWGKKVLLAGHRIVYEPGAAVIHSHERTALYEYRRTYVCHRRLYRLFGLQTIPTHRHLVRAFVSECRRGFRERWNRVRSLRRLAAVPAYALAGTFGQYAGASDESAGRPLPRWRV